MSKLQQDDPITAEDDFKDLFPGTDIVQPPEVKTNGVIGETPHRCTNCDRLLFKGVVGENGKVSIKCKCGTMNTFKVHHLHDPNVNFQDKILHNRTRRLRK